MKTVFTHGDKVSALAAGQVQDAVAYGLRKATGDITFSDQPTANDTVTINGTVFTAVASGAAGNQFNIGLALTNTLDNLASVLNGSTVAGVALATYSNVGGTKLHASYDAFGSAGNAFTLAKNSSVATVSGATLSGGTDADAIDLKSETVGLITATGGDQTFPLKDGVEGQELTVYLQTEGGTSHALVTGNFVGGSTLTLSAAYQLAKLKFIKDKWAPLANTGALA